MTDTRTPTVAPYGSWRSPVTAKIMAEGGVGTQWPQSVDESLYWVELRPTENGRYVVVRRAAGGDIADVTPPGVSARTLVHEYGGGMYAAFRNERGGESVIFSDQADQRLYRQDLEEAGEGEPARWSAPAPITPAPPSARAHRYADGRVTADGRTLVSVRERHEDDGIVVNELVSLPADGSAGPRVIATGHDFYAAPRLDAEGRRVAWLSWDHPRMPWDGTELWTAKLAGDGGVSGERLVAGGPDESILQPLWSPTGELWFASDRTGWYNLYAVAVRRSAALSARDPREAEFAAVPWVFGLQQYAFLADGRLVVCFTEDGSDRLAVLDAPAAGDPVHQATLLRDLGSPYSAVNVAHAARDSPRPDRRDSHRGLAGGRRRPGRRRTRQRRGRLRGRPPRPSGPHRPRIHQPAGGDRLPHGGRPHGARQLLPAGESGLRRAGGRAAAVAGHRPRRPHVRARGEARPRRPVLDVARNRRGRRQLRRVDRLRPRVPRTAQGRVGRRRHGRLPSMPRST